MKKWLTRIGSALLLVFIILAAAVFWGDSDSTYAVRYVRNEAAPTIMPGWKGTPVDEDGRFVNDEFPFLPKTIDLLRWQLSANPFAEEKARDTFRPEVLDPRPFFAETANGAIWLGHASFYIRLNGKGILIDPIFGSPALIKRYTEVPSPLEHIKRLDYVLLTHDHRDHMDHATLQALREKFPAAIFLAGLGSEELLSDIADSSDQNFTTGWFQEFPMADPDLKIYFLPVRHWSRRGLFDTNRRLWGGYIIESKDVTIYHGGDSGYGRHYRQTGERFPNINVALLGIGAYEPRWFMEPTHNAPGEVIRAFSELGAETLVPMHYATFDLSDEPPGAPLRELNAEAEKAGLTHRIRKLNINESLELR